MRMTYKMIEVSKSGQLSLVHNMRQKSRRYLMERGENAH